MLRVFFLTFVVAVIFGGSLYIGPATMRQYMAVVLFLYCLANLKGLSKHVNSYIWLFFIFVLFYGFCSIVDDGFSDFLRLTISAYGVGMVGYLATILYMKRYGDYEILIRTLLVCGVINGLVTLLQYIHNPIGIAIGALFVDADNYQKVSEFSHVMDGESGIALPGMFGDAVLNAYFMLLMPLFLLKYWNKRKGKVKQVLYLALLLFYVVLIFAAQEKSALLVVLFVSLGYVYYKLKPAKRILMLIFIGIVVVTIPVIISQDWFSESRFAEDNSDEPRLMIYSNYISYLLENPLWGGLNAPYKLFGSRSHNVVLNAFCYAGIIGGSAVLYLIFKQMILSIQNIKNNICVGVSLGFIAYTLNGLFHNPSLVTGDVILWVLWGLIFYSSKNTSKSINGRKGNCHNSCLQC